MGLILAGGTDVEGAGGPDRARARNAAGWFAAARANSGQNPDPGRPRSQWDV
jgi:hypothetical protein